MTRIIAWWGENHVAANLLMMLMLIGGLVSIPVIDQKSFPDIETETIAIGVAYPGAAPEEVEEGICIRIEEEIQGITGIKRITSTASEGACGVSAELLSGYSIDRALSDIKNAVDGIDTFPDEAEEPVVEYIEVERSAVQIALSGTADERALKVWGERLRDGLSAQAGISRVSLLNARDYEVTIEVPEASLRRHGLSFDQVAAAVRQGSLDLPGGSIKTSSGEILLRTKGQAYIGREFEDLVVITREDGTRLLLGEIATIVDGFEDDDRYARFDGEPAVLVRVQRVGSEKVLEVVETSRAFVAGEGAQLPAGLEMTVWRDGAKDLRDRLGILAKNGIAGFVLVFAMLAFFLRFRLAIWVSVGVPIAFAGSLIFLPFLDISIDVISTFAFIMVLGLLVDDAIVVGENVYTHQESADEDPLQAGIRGAQEVAIPVIFGVLTTIVAFLPMIAAPGTMGQIFGAIGTVVICCLVASLIESQWILPAHLGHHAGATRPSKRAFTRRWREIQNGFAEWLRRFADERYGPALDRVLEWRYSAAAGAVAILLVAFTFIGTGRIKFTFFPEIEADYVTASVAMPQGTPIELTAKAVEDLEGAATALGRELNERFASEDDPIIRHVMASVGERTAGRSGPGEAGANVGSHYGEVAIEIMSGDRRPIPAKEIADRWRQLTPPIPDVEDLTYSSDYFSVGEDIDIQLESPNTEDLRVAADRLRAELAVYPGVIDITDSFQAGKQEIKLSILPSAQTLGVTLQDLARQVRQAFYGEEAQRIQRGRDDVKVMVRFPKDQRRSLDDLAALRIRTPDGTEVPFESVARAEMGRGFSSIKRADRKRVINVTAGVIEPQGNANEVIESLQKEFLPSLVADYPGLGVSLEGQQADQNESLGALRNNYIVALFGIYALLAIPLRSYLQPFIIMAVIPFGVVGALIGHLLMGGFTGMLPGWLTVTRAVIGFSMMSVFGIVAVSGVVVNASLVLTHYINGRIADGVPLRQAVREAGLARFRPIVLTSLTTFVGLTPLLLERSSTAQFIIPMACSLAFGSIFSTVVSLFLVPSAYVIVDDLTRGAARARARVRGGGADDLDATSTRAA